MKDQDVGSACATGIAKGIGRKDKETTRMIDEDWKNIDTRAFSNVCFCLKDEVLFNIVGE
jgi:hypothetical protein